MLEQPSVADSPSLPSSNPATPTSPNSSTCTEHSLCSFTAPNTSTAPRPFLQPALSTSPSFLHTLPTPVAHNNGATVSASSTFCPTPTTTTTSSPPIQSTSNSTSIPTSPNAATINMATSMLAPQLLASPTASTIAAPNSNNSKTTFPFLQNSPYVIGIHTTTSTTTPPFNLPPMTHMTRPGSKSTTTSLTGCLPSTGLSFPTTSSSKLRAGNSQNTEPTSTPDWPPTNDFSDAFGNASTLSENHTYTPPPSITPSNFFATLPNTPQPPLKQPKSYEAAATPTSKSMQSGEWPQTWKNLAAAELSTSSTKP